MRFYWSFEANCMSQDEGRSVFERLTRRNVLQVGSLGALGLGLPSLLSAESQRGPSKNVAADSCILIFLNGGPSHLDMWDMKPQAPTGIRGEFNPIATSQ